MTDREAINLFEENMMYWGNEPLAKNVVAADRLAVSALQERIEREKGCKKPMTNADRIRAMSDEELSEWILRNIACGKEGVMCIKSANSCNGRCRKNRLNWLRQPAKED